MQLKKQQKNNRALTLFFMAMLLTSLHSVVWSKTLPEKQIKLKHVLQFESLKPTINPTYLFVYHNAIAVDKEGNIYYNESDRHRIMKFSREGKFIKQIGKIGKGEDGLYYPKTILIKDNLLHVLDVGIKVFDLEGNFKHCFQFQGEHIDKSMGYSSFIIDEDRIFVDAKYYCKNYNEMPLITAFNLAGLKMETFGRIRPGKRYLEYNVANDIFLIQHEQKLYGAYQSYPGIFCYDRKGDELFYKSLDKIDIDEQINLLFRQKIESHEKEEDANRIKVMNYIYGFWVDKEGNIYITTKDFKNNDFFVLKLDRHGIPIAKLKADYKGKPLNIESILSGQDGKVYIIGSHSAKESFLFEWPIHTNFEIKKRRKK
jgi:hypothetical protein